ncbi:MAG: hypothetical protein RQ990_07795 [Candidatus Hydrothermia bacterium]|nr:hypothetical protein [Candidatus Hydrothermia bacterium]
MKMKNLCYKFFEPPILVIRNIFGREHSLDLGQKLYNELKNNKPYQPLNRGINGILVSSINNVNYFKQDFQDEFQKLFKQNIQLQIVNPTHLNGLNFNNYQIIIWVVGNSQDYQTAKNFKKKSKVPVQIVRYSKINNNYAISNICLNVYCKLGGVPWIIETNFDCYVIGIIKKIIGKGYKEYRVKLFQNNGLLISSFGPDINLDSLLNELKSKLKDINKISFHFRLKPSKEEISAIEEIFKDKEYAIIYINLYSIFRIFDTSNKYYIPERGLFIRIRKEQGFILSDGLVNSKRGKPGFPHALDVEIKKSTINSDEYEELFKQVYHFCYVNYKSLSELHFPSTPASII